MNDNFSIRYQNSFDIYIVTRDRAELLKEVLISLQNQTIGSKNINVFIVESSPIKSVENKFKVFSKVFRNFIFLKSKCNIAALGYYFLFKNFSSSKYSVKLDDDVTLENNYLEKAKNLLEDNPSCVACSCPVYYLGKQDKIWYSYGHFIEKVSLVVPKRKFTDKNVNNIVSCMLVIRSSALRSVGGFSKEFFLYSDDTYLCYLLSKKGTINLLKDSKGYHAVPFKKKRSGLFCEYNDFYSKLKLIEKIKCNKFWAYVFLFNYFCAKFTNRLVKGDFESSKNILISSINVFIDYSKKEHKYFPPKDWENYVK